MAKFDQAGQALVGRGGSLAVRDDDEITRKLCMLVEGECEGLGPLKAARKFGFSKQRYFQLRAVFLEAGAAALQSRKRGPKTHYRRTAEVVRQVIRHRFLDPEASAEVIAQKLTQSGWTISIRSVQRVVEEFGLHKKKLHRCRPRRDEPKIQTQRTIKHLRLGGVALDASLTRWRCVALGGMSGQRADMSFPSSRRVAYPANGRTCPPPGRIPAAVEACPPRAGHATPSARSMTQRPVCPACAGLLRSSPARDGSRAR